VLALFAQLFEQGSPVHGQRRFSKLDGMVGNGVVCFAIVGQCVIEEDAIKVLLPELAAATL
jgi:hypothetical protein